MKHLISLISFLIVGLVILMVGSAKAQDAMFIDSDGNVGIGTNAPASRLDVSTTAGAFLVGPFGSGSVKLSSTASYGMDASQYRFQTSGVDRFFIGNKGNIGIGTLSPSSALEVNTGAGTFNVEAFGAGSVKLSSSASYGMDASQYRFLVSGTDTFFIGNSRRIGIGTNAPSTRLEVNGEVTATAFNTSSSVDVKTRLNRVDGKTILAKLDALPVKEWSYKENPDYRHIGPMAEDFHAKFGLGMDNKRINLTDMVGVALAATKALRQENASLRKESAEKDNRIDSLEIRIKRLEKLVLDLE